jgi:hypothetical protein
MGVWWAHSKKDKLTTQYKALLKDQSHDMLGINVSGSKR